MNDSERRLIRFVCDGDMRNAQKAVKIILDSISSKKDEQFKENMFRKLESKREFIELPYNLQHLLIAEDTEEFPEARFLLRNEEKSITQKIVAIYRASEKLNEMGIPYLPALMLYGQSGCGKTMLARYIAHKAKLPFLRIQFSSLVDSHLGQTQSNLAKIFDYDTGRAAWHCSDIPYFLHNAEMIPICHQTNYEFLNRVMSGAFVNFARTGNPNVEGLPKWQPCTKDHMVTMVFDDTCYTKENMQDELLPLVLKYKPPFEFKIPVEDPDSDEGGNAWVF